MYTRISASTCHFKLQISSLKQVCIIFQKTYTQVSLSSVMVPCHVTVTHKQTQKLLVIKQVVLNTVDFHQQH